MSKSGAGIQLGSPGNWCNLFQAAMMGGHLGLGITSFGQLAL